MNHSSRRTLVERVATLIATFFCVGHAPFMPGTVASLVAAIMLFFIPSLTALQIMVLVSVLLFVGVWASGIVEAAWHIKDPSRVVIDEVLGMSIALCMLPKVPWVYVAAFIIFRILDISKLYPINL